MNLNLSIIIFSAFVLVACSTPENNQEQIEERIQSDLETKVVKYNWEGLDSTGFPIQRYDAEMNHSSISFKTGHWETVDLIGWFEDFQISMWSDSADFSDAVICASVNPTSIKMPNTMMAESAQKAPYIDSNTYGSVSFMSDSLVLRGENDYMLFGTFQMNGIEMKEEFEVKFNGFSYPGEKSICGFNVEGSINRHEYGITDDPKLHSGKKIHDDEIHLFMSLRME